MATKNVGLLQANPIPQNVKREADMDSVSRGDLVKTILGDGDKEEPKWRVYDGCVEGKDTFLEQGKNGGVTTITSERKYLQFGWETQPGVVCINHLYRKFGRYDERNGQEYRIRKAMLVLANKWDDKKAVEKAPK